MITSQLYASKPETKVQRIAHFSMLIGCAVLCLGLTTTAAVRMGSQPAVARNWLARPQ